MQNHETTIAPLALTMGEPAGIGGELALKAWRLLRLTGPHFFLIDNPDRLQTVASQLGPDIQTRVIERTDQVNENFSFGLPILPVGLASHVVPGRPDTRNAPAVIASIERAVALTLTGHAGGIVTNPINKSTMYSAGFAYPGHTEYLEAIAGTGVPAVMMLASARLRVVLVTVHLALKDAIKALSTERIVQTTRITCSSLRRDFGIAEPRIAVAGLNPHAGESGSMGDEEDRIIKPAIDILRHDGLNVVGPLPPDSMFTPRMRAAYDVAICMYHDQALIPIKTIDVDEGVNVTLGLRIVRTSPDHGTALDIAGKNIADPGSLVAAIRMAAEIAARRASAREKS